MTEESKPLTLKFFLFGDESNFYEVDIETNFSLTELKQAILLELEDKNLNINQITKIRKNSEIVISSEKSIKRLKQEDVLEVTLSSDLDETSSPQLPQSIQLSHQIPIQPIKQSSEEFSSSSSNDEYFSKPLMNLGLNDNWRQDSEGFVEKTPSNALNIPSNSNNNNSNGNNGVHGLNNTFPSKIENLTQHVASFSHPTNLDIQNCLISIEAIVHGPATWFRYECDDIAAYQESIHSRQKYMFCLTSEAIIVVFDSAHNVRDFACVDPTTHITGIESLANTIPISHFVAQQIEYSSKKLIFTGIGSGAGVASLVCLRLLQELVQLNEDEKLKRIICITFGMFTPFQKGWDLNKKFVNNFHHYIHFQDSLPRFFAITESVRLLDTLKPSVESGSFLSKLDKLLESVENPNNSKLNKATKFMNKVHPGRFGDTLKRVGKLWQNFVVFGNYYLISGSNPHDIKRFSPKECELEKILPLNENHKSEFVFLLQNYRERLIELYALSLVGSQHRSEIEKRKASDDLIVFDEPKSGVTLIDQKGVRPPFSKLQQSIEVRAYKNKTVILIRAHCNLEFTTEVSIPKLNLKFVPSLILFNKLRMEIPTVELPKELVNEVLDVIVTTHFGTYICQIQGGDFIPRHSTEVKENIFARMSVAEILYKTLILYTLWKKINFVEKCRIIEYIFEVLQLNCGLEDLILSCCHADQLKKFEEKLNLEPGTVIKQLTNFVSKSKPDTSSFSPLVWKYKHLEKDLPKSLLEILPAFRVSLKKESLRDFQGTSFTKWSLVDKEKLPISEFPPLEMDITEIDDSIQLKDYMMLLNIIQFKFEEPLRILSAKTRRELIISGAGSLPAHILVAPVSVLCAVLGLLVGSSLGVGKAMKEGDISEVSLGLSGAIAGGSFLHYAIHAMINRKYNLISNYENRIIFITTLINSMKRVIHYDEGILSELLTYAIETQLVKVDGALIEEVKDYYDTSLKFEEETVSTAIDGWMHSIRCIHVMRNMLIQSHGIACVGTCKTGKSYFLNKMWGCDTNPGARIPTKRITPFQLENIENFLILDFPGSDEINPVWKECHRDGIELVSFYVVILDWEHINIEQKKILEFISQSEIPFMICLNKADTLYLDAKKTMSLTEIKLEVQRIFEERLEKIHLPLVKPSNTFLTCFDDSFVPLEFRHEMKECGIFSLEDIRSFIEQILKDMDYPGTQIVNAKSKKSSPSSQFYQTKSLPYHPNLEKFLPKVQEFQNLKKVGGSSDHRQYLDILGKGTQGVAQLIFNHKTQNFAVVKKIYCQNPVEAQRAHQEFETIASLSHPNIIKPYDTFTIEYEGYSAVCIEMPYFVDGDLKKKIQTAKNLNKYFDINFVLDVLLQLSSCLNYLHHSCNIIHRDIKPQNILLDEKRVVLADFGIAKKESPNRPNETIMVGTPDYLSPEMRKRQVGQPYSYKVDIFSLGCTIFELITLEAPNKIVVDPYDVKKEKKFHEIVLNCVCKVFPEQGKSLGIILKGMLNLDDELRSSSKTVLEQLHKFFSLNPRTRSSSFLKSSLT